MIGFNHNILFVDELQLDNASFNDTLKTIPVKQYNKTFSCNDFTHKTDFVEMSGQLVRYLGLVSFPKMKQGLSWAMEIKEVVTLIWNSDKREISYVKGSAYRPERLRFWVLHTFLPFVFELGESYRILHVGSVEIENRPVLFYAPSFGGKSTMTNYFIQKGHTMLSDDSLAIDKHGDKYYAVSSYPFHRPYRELETLGYHVDNFATEPKPLHAVYLLEKSEFDTVVEITEVSGIEKFRAFHLSTFINLSFMHKEKFEFYIEMAKYVSVYKIKIPWNLKRLPEVYEAIVTHSHKI